MKKKPYIWWWIAAALSFIGAVQLFTTDISAAIFGIVITAVLAFLGWRSFDKPRKARQAAERARAESAAHQRAFEAKHGRIYCKVAGVTFDNDDGTSRQRILKAIAKNTEDDPDVELRRSEYNGKPCIYVICEGRCVGTIPRENVNEVLSVYSSIEFISIDAESFENDDDETIYRADLTIQYARQ